MNWVKITEENRAHLEYIISLLLKMSRRGISTRLYCDESDEIELQDQVIEISVPSNSFEEAFKIVVLQGEEEDGENVLSILQS